MSEPYDLASLSLPPDSELPLLAAQFPHASVLRFADEEFLVRAGDRAASFFLLLRGTCVVELAPPEPEEDDILGRAPQHGADVFTLTATPARPLFVGEMACFGDGLRSASVRSSMNSVAMELDLDDLHAILETFPRLTRTLCEQFSERLIDLNGQLGRHRKQLRMQAEQRFVEPETVLFRTGDAATLLFQLVDGMVALRYPHGEEVRLQPKGGRAVFIEPYPYFVQGHHACSAIAMTHGIVVAIADASREAVVRNFPHLTLDLLNQHPAGQS